MIGKGLFSQVAIIAVAMVIIFMYIRPTFIKVGGTQEDITRYQEERDKVVNVNSLLANLVAKMDSVPPDDQLRLKTYLPDSVDEISVSRDLFLITKTAGASYKSVDFSKSAKESTKTDPTTSKENSLPVAHEFTLSVDGTYDQLKTLFVKLAENNYPLEVQEVHISREGSSFLTAEITLVTYSYQNNVISS